MCVYFFGAIYYIHLCIVVSHPSVGIPWFQGHRLSPLLMYALLLGLHNYCWVKKLDTCVQNPEQFLLVSRRETLEWTFLQCHRMKLWKEDESDEQTATGLRVTSQFGSIWAGHWRTKGHDQVEEMGRGVCAWREVTSSVTRPQSIQNTAERNGRQGEVAGGPQELKWFSLILTLTTANCKSHSLQ